MPSRAAPRCGATGSAMANGLRSASAASTFPAAASRVTSSCGPPPSECPAETGFMPTARSPDRASPRRSATDATVLPTPVSVPVTKMPRATAAREALRNPRMAATGPWRDGIREARRSEGRVPSRAERQSRPPAKPRPFGLPRMRRLLRLAPRHRSTHYDLRRESRIHPHFARQRDHGGVPQSFPTPCGAARVSRSAVHRRSASARPSTRGRRSPRTSRECGRRGHAAAARPRPAPSARVP